MPNCSTVFLKIYLRIGTKNITLQGEILEAIKNVKTSLAKFTKLNYIMNDDKIKITLTTDALSTAVGAVIRLRRTNHTHIFIFW